MLKQNPYYKFTLNLFLFFSIVYLFDFIIGKTLNHFYFKQLSGPLYRTTNAMEKTEAELLIFGSSRANHHYFPDIFENNLSLKYYNVGRDGNFIFYHYAVLKSILNRYNPKMIILDFKGDEFAKEKDSYDRLSSLLPYYKTHPEIREIIELKSLFEKFKLLSNIYPYNSLVLTILAGNSEFNIKRKLDMKGYVPLNGSMKISERDWVRTSNELDTNKINAYKSFIADCISTHVKLVIVYSPRFNPSKSDPSVDLAKSIAKFNNIVFFDYSCDTTYNYKLKYFFDAQHLNIEGSKKFSENLCEMINKKNMK